MATSEVLLIHSVSGLGNEGDQVKVRAGHARNYLLPRGLAVPVSRANKRQIEALLKVREEREALELEEVKDLAQKLEATSVAIPVKTGKSGKMFGAVTALTVIERLNEENFKLEKKQVFLQNPVKTLGKHFLKIKLHPKVVVDLKFEVVSENPIEESKPEGS